MLLTLFLNMTGNRQRRLKVPLRNESLGEIVAFLRGFAKRAGWNEASTERLAVAGEEMLVVLLQEHRDAETPLRLSVSARPEDHAAELEFVTSLEGENVEDHLSYLSALAPVPDKRECRSGWCCTTRRRLRTGSTMGWTWLRCGWRASGRA